MKRILGVFTRFWTWLFLFVAIGAGAWIFASGRSDAVANVQTANLPTAPAASFVAVARGQVDIEGGVIEVAARSGGTFREVLVEEGDRVEAGEALAVQEDDRERFAVRQAQASLESAHISIEQARLELEIAEREQARMELQRAQDAVPQQSLDTANDTVRRLRLALQSREIGLRQAEASLQSALFALEQRTIRAPVAGRIIEVQARPGMGASTLQVSTAFLLMPDAERIVRVELGEVDIQHVQPGQLVQISPSGRPTESFEGTVQRVAEIFGQSSSESPSRRSRSGSQSETIEVIIRAGDIPLRIGQPVLVRFMSADTQPEGGRP